MGELFDRTDGVTDLVDLPANVKLGTPDFFNICRILQKQAGRPSMLPTEGGEYWWSRRLLAWFPVQSSPSPELSRA